MSPETQQATANDTNQSGSNESQPEVSPVNDPIRIKPHHFVDIMRDLGAGDLSFAPHPYGHAVHIIAGRILDNRDASLVIELGADDICEPCVHNIDGLCDDTIDTTHRPSAPTSKREYNLLLDRRWCERLGLKQGDHVTAPRLAERIRDRSGDIGDIYREEPADLTASRARNLRRGLAAFIGES